jgi:hypothetical protein
MKVKSWIRICIKVMRNSNPEAGVLDKPDTANPPQLSSLSGTPVYEYIGWNCVHPLHRLELCPSFAAWRASITGLAVSGSSKTPASVHRDFFHSLGTGIFWLTMPYPLLSLQKFLLRSNFLLSSKKILHLSYPYVPFPFTSNIQSMNNAYNLMLILFY